MKCGDVCKGFREMMNEGTEAGKTGPGDDEVMSLSYIYTVHS